MKTKLKYDNSADGWKLIENKPFKGKVKNLELVTFLKEGEEYITGEIMKERAKEIKCDCGQELAEYLLEHQELIPEEARKYYLVFPGTVWQYPGGDRYVPVLHLRFVPCLYLREGGWCLDFDWLGYDWDDDSRLVSLRKLAFGHLDLENRVKELEEKMSKIKKFLII